MKLTKNQTPNRTLSDMYRALDRQHPVTITALKEEKDAAGKKTGRLIPTVRTIELYAIETTAAGNVILIAMDRESRARRTFRLDRLISYTTHRTSYVVPRETPADRPAPIAPTTPAALVAYELGRDERPAARQLAPAA
jgi:predicted DNA-binding transcriptional regulator YafY